MKIWTAFSFRQHDQISAQCYKTFFLKGKIWKVKFPLKSRKAVPKSGKIWEKSNLIQVNLSKIDTYDKNTEDHAQSIFKFWDISKFTEFRSLKVNDIELRNNRQAMWWAFSKVMR